MRSVLPVNTMAIAMGLHARCGNEDTLWGRKGEKMTSVAADPAAGPHRRRTRPRGRHRQGSPRDLPARRALRQRRRDARQARLRPQPPARPGRLHPARLTHPRRGRGTSPVLDQPGGSSPTTSTRFARSTSCEPQPRPVAARRVGAAPFRVWRTRNSTRGSCSPSTFGLLLSDYMSRQVLSAVFPFLKAEWALSDSQLGLAQQRGRVDGRVCSPCRCRCSPTGGAGSAAWSLMAVLWSIATLLCAVADNYEQMLGARFLVGVGEAAYGSVGIARGAQRVRAAAARHSLRCVHGRRLVRLGASASRSAGSSPCNCRLAVVLRRDGGLRAGPGRPVLGPGQRPQTRPLRHRTTPPTPPTPPTAAPVSAPRSRACSPTPRCCAPTSAADCRCSPPPR